MLDVLAIKTEREELERQLRDDPDVDPRYLMVLHLRELEALYARTTVSSKGNGAAHSAPTPPPRRDGGLMPPSWLGNAAFHSRGTGKVIRRIAPGRVRVLEQAANLIRGKHYPTRTIEIYEALSEEDRSLIGGNDKKGNLSAMLHHSPMFISRGRAGWMLAEDAPDPPEVISDEGEDVRNFTLEQLEEGGSL